MLKKMPHTILWMGAMFLIILAFLDTKNALDINIHDTYFVIAYAHLYLIGAMLLLALWVIYILADGILLSKNLTWIHVVITVAATILLASMQVWKFTAIPRDYYAFSEFSMPPPVTAEIWIFINFIFVLLLAQVCFVVNILGGILKKLSA